MPRRIPSEVAMTEAATDKNLELIGKVVANMPFARYIGLEFVEGGDGYAKLRLRFQQENTTANDALHGGAVASLIDTTGAMAAWTTSQILKNFGSTVGVNVNYLSGVIGEDCFAEGRVLKRGKEIIYSDVRVTSGAGKLLAQGTVVYRIIERKQD
jgi:uncharacterized protein (TIGR00369 family)